MAGFWPAETARGFCGVQRSQNSKDLEAGIFTGVLEGFKAGVVHTRLHSIQARYCSVDNLDVVTAAIIVNRNTEKVAESVRKPKV